MRNLVRAASLGLMLLHSSLVLSSDLKVCTGATIVNGEWTCTSSADADCHNNYCTHGLVTAINGTHGRWACDTYRDSCSACFNADTIVFRDGEAVKIQDIRLGDMIEDGANSQSKVIGFLHRDPDAQVKLLGLFTKDSEKAFLVVSGEHLLSDDKGDFRYASSFVKGNLLKLSNGQTIEVDHVETTLSRGLFAPLTESGVLLTGQDKVVSSCYAHFSSHKMAHQFVRWTGGGSDGTHVKPRWIDTTLLSLMRTFGLAY